MNNLKPHQKQIIDTIKDKSAMWMAPRTGKTPTSVRLACSRAKSCLVIVPKHIKEQWEKEISTWSNTDCKFILITKERFRIDSISGIVNKGRRKTLLFSDNIPKCDAILIDEVHRQASNYANKFFKTVDNYINTNSIDHVWLLSGTPWNKNPWSVYSYGKLLGMKWDWLQWQHHFFTKITYGTRSFYKPNESKFPELIELLNKLGPTVKLSDIADISDDEETVEYFDLNPTQKKMIKGVTDTTPVARYVKYHQIEQSVMKSDGYTDDVLDWGEKDNRMVELVEDNDKVIVVCRYLLQIEKYAKYFSQNGDKKVFVIQGTMKQSLEDVRKEAEESEKAVVIVQADKSDGYSLKSFSTMIFASMSYSFISYDQMKNRMKAMEKPSGCSYIYLLTRGKTVDQGIYNSVMKGNDFNEKLYELQ